MCKVTKTAGKIRTICILKFFSPAWLKQLVIVTSITSFVTLEVGYSINTNSDHMMFPSNNNGSKNILDAFLFVRNL